MPAGNAYPFWYLVPSPFFELACDPNVGTRFFRTCHVLSVLMLRPFFPELVMSTDLLSFEHPSVLLFCFTRLFTLNTPWYISIFHRYLTFSLFHWNTCIINLLKHVSDQRNVKSCVFQSYNICIVLHIDQSRYLRSVLIQILNDVKYKRKDAM